MNFQKLLVATSLAFAAMSASATPVPLDSLTGPLNIKLSGLTTESNTYGALLSSTRETTWGVGAITEVQATGGKKWQSGSTDNTYLYYMIYGIADLRIVNNGNGTFDIYNIGATGFAEADGLIHLDIYRSNTEIIAIDSDFNAAPSGRTGYNSYNLLNTLGPAYLKVVLSPGKQTIDVPGGPNETTATMVQHANAAQLPASGSGDFFADVVGGTAFTAWDTNGQFGHDLDGHFTLTTNGTSQGSGVCTDAQVTSNACFTGLINDPIKANKIPEPASLALFGLALAGLAGARRRKSK